MRLGQVADVDVIAHTGAVGSGVFVAENIEGRPLAADGFKRRGDQVRFRTVYLADGSGFVGPGSVEVTKTNITQLVGGTVGLEGLLKNQFGDAVGIYRDARQVLGDGHSCRGTVDGATGGENKLADFRVEDRIQQGNSAQHVVLEIFSGIDYRFTYVGVGSEVHHCVNPLQQRRQFGGVGDIPDHQLEALRERGMAGTQIVVNDGFIAAALERVNGVTAYVSCSSDD